MGYWVYEECGTVYTGSYMTIQVLKRASIHFSKNHCRLLRPAHHFLIKFAGGDNACSCRNTKVSKYAAGNQYLVFNSAPAHTPQSEMQ